LGGAGGGGDGALTNDATNGVSGFGGGGGGGKVKGNGAGRAAGNGGYGRVRIRYFGQTDAASGGAEGASGSEFRYHTYTPSNDGNGTFVASAAAASQVATFSGNLSGNGGITKNGLGTLLLDGTNTYTGATIVNAGVLGGNGSSGSAFTLGSGGTLAPGGSIGTAAFDSADLDGTLDIEIDGAQTDLLNVTGNLDLSGGTSILNVTANDPSGSYVIATYGGTLTGTFNIETLPDGYSVDYGAGSNSQITLVPEPSTFTLIALGLLGLLACERRRRR